MLDVPWQDRAWFQPGIVPSFPPCYHRDQQAMVMMQSEIAAQQSTDKNSGIKSPGLWLLPTFKDLNLLLLIMGAPSPPSDYPVSNEWTHFWIPGEAQLWNWRQWEHFSWFRLRQCSPHLSSLHSHVPQDFKETLWTKLRESQYSRKKNLSLFFDNDNDSVICNNQPVGLNNKSKDNAK